MQDTLFENYSGFRPRWETGYWSDFHGWLHVAANALVWSSYITIPMLIIWFVRQKKAPFNKLYLLFAFFILICSGVFLVDTMLFWYPVYKLDTVMRLVTGVFSWIAAIALIRILPFAFSLRTPTEFEAELALRKKVEDELTAKNKQLQDAEKIAHICYAQWDVEHDRIELSDEGYNMFGIKRDKKYSLADFIKLLHPDDRKKLEEILRQMVTDKQFYEFNFRTKHKDGGEKYFSSKGEVITNEDGKVRMLVGTLQDVTEQQQHVKLIRGHLKRLEEIAWIQNHLVRGPVTTILGLTQLIRPDEPDHADNHKALKGIIEACHKLDHATRDIDAQTYPNRPEQ